MSKRYWNIDLEEMMEARVHLGHKNRKWNPNMAPYIFTKRKDTHIINLAKTTCSLSEACDLVFDIACRGKQSLIVGKKYQATDLVASAVTEARCHYVNIKWLCGMLNNWSTIEMRLQKFKDLKKEQDTGRFNQLPKKEAAMLKRQLDQLQKYLGGIRYMTSLPDIAIITNQREESISIGECRTLGISTICLVDTDFDPDLMDIPIPANDDGIASIQLILNRLASAIFEGRALRSL